MDFFFILLVTRSSDAVITRAAPAFHNLFMVMGVITSTSTESFKRRALILSRPNALLVFKSLMDLEAKSSLIG